MIKAAPAPGITDDTLFELRYARSHDDLWGMLTRLYGAHPGFAGTMGGSDECGVIGSRYKAGGRSPSSSDSCSWRPPPPNLTCCCR